MQLFMMLTFLFPVLAGSFLTLFIDKKKPEARKIYVASVVIITSILVFVLIFNHSADMLTLIHLNEKMSIAFKVDGLSCVFLMLIAVLWPIAIFYSFEYMEHNKHLHRFFSFYIITYGVCIGLACSANLITFYLLYECLTLVTLPIVMHEMSNRAVAATRKYFMYSIFGAAVAFMGIMIVYEYGSALTFTYGGVFTDADRTNRIVLTGYLLMFFGFGVKAAVFPFHGWLPSAGVAPTPVTALLHAVAVVKAGVFAIARATFYVFGPTLLMGTWAQSIAMGFAIFTIVFGSAFAWKEQHMKRRLAYSTVSNLSYILFGITLMSVEGLTAALAHMLFHGIMKICLFFCVGAVMEKTGREYVPEVEGLGYKMPVTFTCYTIGALALSGIPMFNGFVSKYALAVSALHSNMPLAVAGVFALLISAVLTAAYTLDTSIRAFFPSKDADLKSIENCKDPQWTMKAPFMILCALMILTGIFASPILNILSMIAQGLM